MIYGIYIAYQQFTLPKMPQYTHQLIITQYNIDKDKGISGVGVVDNQRIRYTYHTADSIENIDNLPISCQVDGHLSAIQPPKNFHQFDYRHYSWTQHIYYHLNIKKINYCTTLKSYSPIDKLINYRHHLIVQMYQQRPTLLSGLMIAMV